MIIYKLYTDELEDVKIAEGFFDGWLNPPDENVHRKILFGSFKSFVAIHEEKKEIIGYINVISDGVLTAYIPFLEVISEYKGQGIGNKLVKMAIEEFKDYYMIDIVCDSDLVHFYEKMGMRKANAMIIRNYDKQSGE